MSRIINDTFDVESVNAGGKVYLRVSRIVCKAASGLTIALDINSEVFPVEKNQKLGIVLTSTLEKDGSAMPDKYDQSIYHRETLMDEFEYVMHGKVFECNCDDVNATTLTALISFGGLLMKIEGKAPSMREIAFNQQYYLLVRRVA